MLYLPAFYLELARVSNLQRETQQWQIFHELVTLQMDSEVSKEQFDIAKQSVSTRFTYSVSIFDCQVHQCYILFSDGEDYEVILEEISSSPIF